MPPPEKRGGRPRIAGTLDVNLARGYTPTVGQTYTILTYGSKSCTFATLSSDSSLGYTIAYGTTSATITITSVPTSSSAPTITTQPARR